MNEIFLKALLASLARLGIEYSGYIEGRVYANLVHAIEIAIEAGRRAP